MVEQAATAATSAPIDFRTRPERYRHWTLSVDGRVALLELRVDPDATLRPGYVLKRNSYDLGVDIELADAVQRLRFEHPEVGCVVITSADAEVFCAGANIQMLSGATHGHKVNFCKFTNETRLAMEDASAASGQRYLCALGGPASGGGYELALACDEILLIDDGNSAVALPELPLLGVLPGTGGLTRLVDKRRVRRDRADYFATLPEGIRGRRALEWGLVDELVPRSQFSERVAARAAALAAESDRPSAAIGVALPPLERTLDGDSLRYEYVSVAIDRERRLAEFEIAGPSGPQPATPDAIAEAGAAYWPLALARQLDDAMLHLRLNEEQIGTWLLRTVGDGSAVAAIDGTLMQHADHWLVREITRLSCRTLKRLDLSARSTIALIEPGSCFVGTLLELALAADRSYMLDGSDNTVSIGVTAMNFGPLPMSNGLPRLATRFLGDTGHIDRLSATIGQEIDATRADELGLVTFVPDQIDWQDEVRLALEARASYSPDALTGLEANLRFAGPETLETKIFGRLSAWQNWIFQRDNAAGEAGALRRYGSGQQPEYRWERT